MGNSVTTGFAVLPFCRPQDSPLVCMRSQRKGANRHGRHDVKRSSSVAGTDRPFLILNHDGWCWFRAGADPRPAGQLGPGR